MSLLVFCIFFVTVQYWDTFCDVIFIVLFKVLLYNNMNTENNSGMKKLDLFLLLANNIIYHHMQFIILLSSNHTTLKKNKLGNSTL